MVKIFCSFGFHSFPGDRICTKDILTSFVHNFINMSVILFSPRYLLFSMYRMLQKWPWTIHEVCLAFFRPTILAVVIIPLLRKLVQSRRRYCLHFLNIFYLHSSVYVPQAWEMNCTATLSARWSSWTPTKYHYTSVLEIYHRVHWKYKHYHSLQLLVGYCRTYSVLWHLQVYLLAGTILALWNGTYLQKYVSRRYRTCDRKNCWAKCPSWTLTNPDAFELGRLRCFELPIGAVANLFFSIYDWFSTSQLPIICQNHLRNYLRHATRILLEANKCTVLY